MDNDIGVFYDKLQDNEFRHKGLSGMSNLGNTCYMNTAIQCLSNSLLLTNYFLKNKYLEDINTEVPEHHLVLEWKRLLGGIWQSNCTIAPHSFNHIVNILAMKNGFMFTPGQHHDLQEFLVFFIDTMHKALSQEVIITISGDPKNTFDKRALDAMERWKNYFKNDYSILVELFYGQFCTKIMCPGCDYYSHTYDPFCYLSLPLPDRDCNIEECFKLFTDGEELDTDNQWECEKCHKKQNAHRKDSIWKAPKILIIHLKRFNKSLHITKNTNLVKYPLDNLDISDYYSGYEKGSLTYKLYSIGCHTGTMQVGHYYSYCKNNDNKWYCYNDNSVYLMDDEKDVISPETYCLFYIR
jgi:ubiquitin C-terminal hydrolase